MAGLRVGQAFGVLLLPGFGVGSSSPRCAYGLWFQTDRKINTHSIVIFQSESADLTTISLKRTVQPKNNARARSGARSSCAARTRKRQKKVKLRF